MMRTARRISLGLVGTLVGSLVLTGCDFDVYSLPLPGGTDVGDDPITLTVQFEDVLDLVPQSTVKVNDVSVGNVTDIQLDEYAAEVTLELRGDTELPANAVAEIRQTSLLGEKFVSLEAPDVGASDELLGDHDTIPIERTGRNPEVEEVLGALSLLLNGGGVAQMKLITQELNKALTGREDAARSVLTQIETFTANLDENKVEIVAAIESLNRLALAVTRQQDDIDSALDELPSALLSIDGQRDDLVAMLQALNELGDVGVRVIKASKDATIDSLRQLQPVLTELANAGDDFVNAFHVFLTYPFVDDVVGRDPQVARNLHMGDYTNLSITLELDFSQGLPDPPGPPNECTKLSEIPEEGPVPPLDELCQGAIDALQDCIDGLNETPPDLEACEGLPGSLIEEYICSEVSIPPLCGGGGGGGGLPTDLPDLPDLPGLPDPGGLGGLLNRSGAGPWRAAAEGGPTIGELQDFYDADLVSLLVPGMVIAQ